MLRARMSRRQFLHASGAGTMSLALAACVQAPAGQQAGAAGGSAAQAPVDLKLWKAPHKPAGEEVQIAENVLAGFHERHPDIRVEYSEVPWAQYGEALTAGYASDDPPDVAYQTEGISRYALPGQLEALDGWFDLEPELKEKFQPQAFGPATIGGKLYGVPWVLAGNVQLWNKTLFEQAGLDPNKPANTWEEIIEYGKKLTNPDADQFGFMIGPRTALEFHGWNTVFWPLNAGGKWTNEDFTEIYLDDEKGIQAAEFYYDLFNTHRITPPPDLGQVTGQLMSVFQAGKGGFAFEVNTAIAVIRDANPDFELGVGPKPAGPAEDPKWARAGYGAAGYAAMAANSRHQEQAWELMKYLVEPESLKGWIKLLGWQPVLKDLSFADGDPIIEAVEANLGNAVMANDYIPDKPYRGDVMGEFLNQYEAIALGQKSGRDAMIEGAQRMRELIAARQ